MPSRKRKSQHQKKENVPHGTGATSDSSNPSEAPSPLFCVTDSRQDDHLCSVCLDVYLQNPRQLDPCGHVFCGECSKKLEKDKDPRCPNCRRGIQRSNAASPSIRSVIDSLSGSCENCEWKGTVQDFRESHIQQCVGGQKGCERAIRIVKSMQAKGAPAARIWRFVNSDRCSVPEEEVDTPQYAKYLQMKYEAHLEHNGEASMKSILWATKAMLLESKPDEAQKFIGEKVERIVQKCLDKKDSQGAMQNCEAFLAFIEREFGKNDPFLLETLLSISNAGNMELVDPSVGLRASVLGLEIATAQKMHLFIFQFSVNAGITHRCIGNDETALEFFGQAVETSRCTCGWRPPNFPSDVLCWLIQECVKCQNEAEGLEKCTQLRKWVDFFPDADAASQLAQAYSKFGHHNAAFELAGFALKMLDSDTSCNWVYYEDIKEVIARALQVACSAASALKDLRMLVDLYESFKNVALAGILRTLESNGEVRSTMHMALIDLTDGEQDGNVLLSAAYIFHSCSDREPARSVSLRAMRILREKGEEVTTPTITNYLKSLAMASHSCMRTGRYNEAAEILTKAVELKKKHFGARHIEVAEMMDHLATAYRWAGDYETEVRISLESFEIKVQFGGQWEIALCAHLERVQSSWNRLNRGPFDSYLADSFPELRHRFTGWRVCKAFHQITPRYLLDRGILIQVMDRYRPEVKTEHLTMLMQQFSKLPATSYTVAPHGFESIVILVVVICIIVALFWFAWPRL